MFRAWDVDQGWLLPPSLHAFVPHNLMALFVRDSVRQVLELLAILDEHRQRKGRRKVMLIQGT